MKSLSDLTGPAELSQLLEKQLPCTQVILTEDDPFDSREDMVAFMAKALAEKKPVVFLPHGGHLGYVSEAWTKAKLMALFNNCGMQASAVLAPKK